MKNKYLLGLLTIVLVCALGYGGFQVKRRCDLTEYYISQLESFYLDQFLGRWSGFVSFEDQMREDGYSRAEIDMVLKKGYKRADARRKGL